MGEIISFQWICVENFTKKIRLGWVTIILAFDEVFGFWWFAVFGCNSCIVNIFQNVLQVNSKIKAKLLLEQMFNSQYNNNTSVKDKHDKIRVKTAFRIKQDPCNFLFIFFLYGTKYF